MNVLHLQLYKIRYGRILATMTAGQLCPVKFLGMARTPARTLRIDFRAARTPRARTRWRHTHLAWTCTTIDEWCSWTTPEKYDCGPDDNSTSQRYIFIYVTVSLVFICWCFVSWKPGNVCLHGQSKNTGGAYSLIITIEECASWVEKRWAFTLVFPGSSDQNWPLFICKKYVRFGGSTRLVQLMMWSVFCALGLGHSVST